MKVVGSSTEINSENKNEKAFTNTLSTEAQYELWHQRCLHSELFIMEYLLECVEGIHK